MANFFIYKNLSTQFILKDMDFNPTHGNLFYTQINHTL